jgi:mycothiol synthase
MSQTDKIYPFPLKDASPSEYAALNRHNNILLSESQPDDLATPMEEAIQFWQSQSPMFEMKTNCIWDTAHKEIIAHGTVILSRIVENKHMAQFDIGVNPEHRRQGLGRKLLAQIVQAAQADNRSLLMTMTNNRAAGGEVMMVRIGGQKGLELRVNQLRLVELDDGMIERWITQASQRAGEFELGLWEGPYPENQLTSVVRLMELTNEQPSGDLDIEEVHFTPERIRQIEQMKFAQGNQRWTIYAIDKATGKIAGYTETVWHPNRPEILNQEFTGVFPEYRNRGIGRWLKAAMIVKVLKERPVVKYIRTGNADTNAAMLKINHEMGFKHYMTSVIWQVELSRVMEYLGL